MAQRSKSYPLYALVVSAFWAGCGGDKRVPDKCGSVPTALFPNSASHQSPCSPRPPQVMLGELSDPICWASAFLPASPISGPTRQQPPRYSTHGSPVPCKSHSSLVLTPDICPSPKDWLQIAWSWFLFLYQIQSGHTSLYILWLPKFQCTLQNASYFIQPNKCTTLNFQCTFKLGKNF